jgi:hypothetical protein
MTGRELAEAKGSKHAARRLRALARQPFVGVLAELAGLVGAAEHNGKRATVWPRGRNHDIPCPFALAPSLVCTLRIDKSSSHAWRLNGSRVDCANPRANPRHRCQVRRHLPEKQRYTLELLEPLVGGGGAGQRMDVRPANFVLAHLPAGTRCARARRL